MDKIIVITGGTSGIGLMTAQMLRSKGDKVITLANTGGVNDDDFMFCDVSDKKNVAECFKTIGEKYGYIDVLINCAGYGLNGAFELLDSDKIKKQFDVNVFGLIECSQQALKYMSRGARIINISSAMALFPVPYRSMYGASKSAVLSLSYALRMELKKSGIDVCAICPGDVNTNFTKNKVIEYSTNERYGESIQKAFAKFDDPKRKAKQIKPEVVAKRVVKLCYARRTRPMIIIGGKMKLLHFVCRFTPKSLLLNSTTKICG